MMDECEGGNEGGNRAKMPRRDPVVNPYAKQSIPGGGKIGCGERRQDVKGKGSGAKFNSKNNGPSNIGRG